MANGDGIHTVYGQFDWAGGVDSSRPSTIASEQNPNGLPINMVAWANNANMRGGGISPRGGWQPRVQGQSWSGLYQGGFMYEPVNEFPYLVLDIGGRSYAVRVGTDNSVTDITAAGSPNPANFTKHWLCQGDRFLVIQDGSSTPLVWDGTTMRRINAMGGTPPYLPIGNAMDFHQQRFWVSIGNRAYMGGDLILGTSGTAPYGLRDSILHSVENSYLSGGGSFVVPTNAGEIRALAHTANLDNSLGESQLYVFTRKTIFSLNVPVDRTQWTAVTTNTIPLQRIAQINFGSTSDRSITAVNGDLFFQTTEPGIRSQAVALRYFEQWGNTNISDNVRRAIAANDRALLPYASGILFDNRLLQTCLPFQTPVGVAHRGIIPLDFQLISTLQTKLPPSYCGIWEGLPILQLFEGDFGGRERAFAVALGTAGDIQVWEIMSSEFRDNGDNRIQWSVEFPAYTFDSVIQLKKLVSDKMWVDQVRGTVDVIWEYRPDFGACWNFWHATRICAARDCREVDGASCIYPTQEYCASNRAPLVLPVPPTTCDPSNNVPTNIGYQFQARVTIRGECRIRGHIMYAENQNESMYRHMICAPPVS